MAIWYTMIIVAVLVGSVPAVDAAITHGHQIDHTGKPQKGKASYYGKYFFHRTMANGRRMNPNANIAASKTLPLGSVVKITNLDNGKTATVRIEDRGPYVAGRVVDVAPIVAKKLDFTKQGVVRVEVKPITLPQPDGSVKLGSGAHGLSKKEVARAIADTKVILAMNTRR